MERSRFFDALWEDFADIAPQAAALRQKLEERGERVQNDHIAFRTFNISPLSLSELEPHVLGLGYRLLDEYRFTDKHLRARAYVCAGAPRVFLSELLCEELSEWARSYVESLVALIQQRVGEDLNWIRLNGTFVGGLIGVVLYLVATLAGLGR